MFPTAYLLGLDEASETLEKVPVLLRVLDPPAQSFPSPLLAQLPRRPVPCALAETLSLRGAGLVVTLPSATTHRYSHKIKLLKLVDWLF